MNRVRGLAALAALCAVIGAVPWALVRFGRWPVTGLPSGQQLRALPDALVTDTAVFAVLTLAAWIVWATFLASTAVEMLAAARGVQAPRLAFAGPMQRVAGGLVAALVLALTVSHGPRAAAASVASAPVTNSSATQLDVDAPRPVVPVPAEAAVAPVPSPVLAETVIVRPGDSAWSIAETHFGDGMRWRDLWETNRGVPQSDGQSWIDPQIIRPGWQLRVATDEAQTPEGSVAPTPVAGPEVRTVVPGDTLSEIAEAELGDPTRFGEVFEASRNISQPGGRRLTDPDLIFPGWSLRIPADVPPAAPSTNGHAPPAAPPAPQPAPPRSEADAPPATSPATTTTASAARPDEGPAHQQPAREPAGERQAQDVAGRPSLDATTLGVAGAVLASGFGTLLARRRRLQRIKRPPGYAVPAPGPDAHAAEIAIAVADTDLPHLVDRRLRALADALRDADLMPRPQLAQVYDDRVELLLDEPQQHPPEGWTAVGDGRVWSAPLSPGILLEVDQADRTRPLPTLVAIGALGDGGVLLDLEGHATIAVTGEPEGVGDLIRSIAAELATTPQADVHTVALVGIDIPGAQQLGIVTYPDIASATAAARDTVQPTIDALERLGAASSFELRCRYPDEAWPPITVIVDATSPDFATESLDDLLKLSGTGGRGIAVVVAGTTLPGALEIRVDGSGLEIPAFGLRCQAQRVSRDASLSLGAALDSAYQPAAPSTAEPLTLFDEPNPRSEDTLTVRLLGTLDAEHARDAFKPQQLALLAYLVVQPNASADALRDAIWAGRPPTQERFLNSMHELRRVLGPGRLPPAADGRYRLEGVTSDLACFQRLVTRADNQPHEAATLLREALELVSGPPFSYDSRHRRHFTWVDLGNHASSAERLVADTAHRLSTLARDAGDHDLAAWAARQGLRASPANEALVGDVMSAHLGAGDSRSAESVLNEYERSLEELGIDGGAEFLYELLERRRAS